MLSIRTTKALALFTVMATTVSFSGCGDEEVPQAEERDDYENFAGDVLTDEAGREYKLKSVNLSIAFVSVSITVAIRKQNDRAILILAMGGSEAGNRAVLQSFTTVK